MNNQINKNTLTHISNALGSISEDVGVLNSVFDATELTTEEGLERLAVILKRIAKKMIHLGILCDDGAQEVEQFTADYIKKGEQ